MVGADVLQLSCMCTIITERFLPLQSCWLEAVLRPTTDCTVLWRWVNPSRAAVYSYQFDVEVGIGDEYLVLIVVEKMAAARPR